MRPRTVLFLIPLLWLTATTGFAQDDGQAGDTDGSSEQVESSDEAFRRRMELEDARRQDPSYTDPVDTYKKDLEKIDKLPEESRDNIRDQLVDVIVENGEWEPSDALEDYPYEPTDAAKKDPVLMEQEQEAWDEQIEKYHEREAAAFGTYRGPVPGPGNPTGQQGGAPGGEAGQSGQGSEQGGSGQSGSGQGNGQGNGNAGTYQAGGSNGDDDDVSTAGVSESALDFLRSRQAGSASGAGGSGGPATPPGSATADSGRPGTAERTSEGAAGTEGSAAGSGSPAGQSEADTAGAEQSAAEWAAQAAAAAQEAAETGSEAAAEQQASQAAESQAAEAAEEMAEQTPDIELDTRGIIAIEDLDKLEGTGAGETDPEEEDR